MSSSKKQVLALMLIFVGFSSSAQASPAFGSFMTNGGALLLTADDGTTLLTADDGVTFLTAR
jgi:hypothetical protein